MPQRCSQDLSSKVPKKTDIDKAHLYEKVLSIAQFWGGGFFHATVEQLTRIAAYIPFLKQHPEILIHVESKVSFVKAILEKLGLDSQRLIAGNIRAKVLYYAGSSACARPGVFNVDLMSLWYRASIQTPPEPRTSIIVIRRSPGKRRWFTHHDKIFKMVQKVGGERGFQ